MVRLTTTLITFLGLLFSATVFDTALAQQTDVLVTPEEAEIEIGGTLQIEVFPFTHRLGRNIPIDLSEVRFSVEPDSLGTITEDGFFMAGSHAGTALITVRIVVGPLVFERVVVVIIGRLPKRFFDVAVQPAFAVVPLGGEKQFEVVVRTPEGEPVEPKHVLWDVIPPHLGTISDTGLFSAGQETRHGKVVAIVEIDNLVLRAAARVVVSPPATGAITGNVSSDANAAPIAGALVKAIHLGPIPWIVRSETDADGNYKLGELIPGDYVVFADARGFIGEFYDNTRIFREAAVQQVDDNETITDINFSLSEGGTITGTVVTEGDSLPLPNAHVVAFLRAAPRFARHAITDDNGNYEIDALPTGSYAVFANALGFQGEFYDDVLELSEATLVEVQEPQSVKGIDFALGITSAIRGRVTSAETDSAIAGAHVRVFIGPLVSVHRHFFAETRTNENGEYTVEVRPGHYFVFASAEGFNGEFFDDAREFENADLVEVVPDSHTTGIDFELTPRSSISGTVTVQATGEPIAGAVVEAFKENAHIDPALTNAGFRAKTDELGKYTIDNLPSGKYLVLAFAEGYLPEFFEESAAKDSADLVVVEDNTDVENIDFTLVTGGSISGFVGSEADSLPIGGALVRVFASNTGRHLRTFTNNDGIYKVGGLPTGTYLVQVIAEGFVPELYDNAEHRGDATRVQVTAPLETPGIDVYLKPHERKRGTIAGRVVADVDESPIFGAVVMAVSPRDLFPHITFTGERGFYELTDLPPGKYFVFAWAEGFIGEFYQDAHLFREADPVFVVPEQVTGGIDFGLAPNPRTGIYDIMGRVLSRETNQPIEGALVQAKLDGEVEVNAVTDANGNFAITGLPAGEYKIESTSVGFSEDAATVTVGEGQDAFNVNLEMQTDNVTDVGSGDDGATPKSFALFQNYPNPFNPETTIQYQLSQAAEVTLKIFNLLGQEVRTLVNQRQPAGAHAVAWDGKDNFGRQAATGVYIFQLKAGESFKMSKRMMLVK